MVSHSQGTKNMNDFNYYQGKDIPAASRFLIGFITSVTYVDIDAVKEIKIDSAKIQEMLNKNADAIGARFVDDQENAEFNIAPPVMRRNNDEALIAKVTKLIATQGNVTFKSMDFDRAGYDAKAQELRDEAAARMDEFRNDVEDSHCMQDFSGELKAAIHRKAWDDGHSSGLQEVFNCYDDYVEIAELALKQK